MGIKHVSHFIFHSFLKQIQVKVILNDYLLFFPVYIILLGFFRFLRLLWYVSKDLFLGLFYAYFVH